jgi:oligoendopeptidase F
MTATTRHGRQRRPRALQAGSRPDARDEAAPAVGRAGTIPARHSVVGATAWNKLFDETIAGLSFDVDGEKLGIEGTLNLLTEQDRAKREAGARALAETFQDIRFSPASTTRSPRRRNRRPLAQDADAADPGGTSPTMWSPRSWRRCATPSSPPIPSSPPLLRAEAKWLGLDTLQVWDRNAPLPMEDPASSAGTRRARW